MKQFDYYEFTAILVPGSSFLIVLGLTFPDIFGHRFIENVSVGDLGIFIIISYVLGHVIQAVSSIYEKIFWYLWGGMPSDWVLKKDKDYFTAQQKEKIVEKIRNNMGVTLSDDNIVPKAVCRQIYSLLKNHNQTERIDLFNANYGLNRALAASSLLGLVLSVLFWWGRWDVFWQNFFILFFLTVLLTYRMCTFAMNYAYAIYNGFLNVDLR